MSILSELQNGKITLEQAWQQAEAWGASIIAKAPASVTADINAAVTDVKAAASAAVTVGEELAGPIIDTAAQAAGTAFASAASAYSARSATAITPAALDAIDRIRDGVKAELDSARPGAEGPDRRSRVRPPPRRRRDRGKGMLKFALIGASAAAVLKLHGRLAGPRRRDAASLAGQAAKVVGVVERQSAVSQAVAVRDQAGQDRIRTLTRTLIEKVPVYVPPDVDRRYPLPVGFVACTTPRPLAQCPPLPTVPSGLMSPPATLRLLKPLPSSPATTAPATPTSSG